MIAWACLIAAVGVVIYIVAGYPLLLFISGKRTAPPIQKEY